MGHNGTEETRTKGLRPNIRNHDQSSYAWEEKAQEYKVSLGYIRPYLEKKSLTLINLWGHGHCTHTVRMQAHIKLNK